MKRRSTDRSTRVLAFGANTEQWRYFKSMVKDGLQSAHMGWSFMCDARTDISQALAYIRQCEDLEIVHISSYSDAPAERMLADAKLLAKALAAHKHKPWVAFYRELDYLRPVFEEAGVEVVQYMLVDAIFERWRGQIEDAPRESAA